MAGVIGNGLEGSCGAAEACLFMLLSGAMTNRFAEHASYQRSQIRREPEAGRPWVCVLPMRIQINLKIHFRNKLTYILHA